MKKKRILLTIFILLLILICFGVVCVNIFLLPTKTKALIINKLEQSLGRKVEIKTLRYIPLTTLFLDNVIIYQDALGARELIKIKRASFNFSLLPLLIQKKLISKLDLHNFSGRDVEINGSIRTSLESIPAGPIKFKGTVRLVDFSLKTGFLPHAIKRFNGAINLKEDDVSLDNGYFNFNGIDFQLKARLHDLNEPKMSFSLNSDNLASEGIFFVKNGYIKIEKLDTQFANSSINLIGDISGIGNPLLNIYGESKINMADLALFYPEKKREGIKLAGICNAAIFLKGRLEELQDAELGLKIKSDRFILQDFVFDNFSTDIRMKDGLITTSKLLAGFYEGLISGLINMKPFISGRPYSIDISIKNANLARWAKEAKFGKKIHGAFSSRFLLKGAGADSNSLCGNGWLAITDGYLWETPILSGVSNILNMPNLKSIVFREAAGNFTIGNRKINISDLTFYSDQANLSVRGSMDFDANLDLLITTNITQDLIQGSSDAAEIVGILVQQAGQFLGRVRVTGTLTNPVYKLGSAAGFEGVIKPIEKIFKKEIGNIFKDIFE